MTLIEELNAFLLGICIEIAKIEGRKIKNYNPIYEKINNLKVELDMVPWLQKHLWFMASIKCFEMKVDGWKKMQGNMPEMKMKKKMSVVQSI